MASRWAVAKAAMKTAVRIHCPCMMANGWDSSAPVSVSSAWTPTATSAAPIVLNRISRQKCRR